MIFGLIISYLSLQILIGYFISRRIHSESDYLIGGRQFSTLTIALSLFATWFGAETCIGTSGAVYLHGLSGGRADPFGYSLCLLLSGLFIARKIWKSNYLTLSDFFLDRFGPKTCEIAVWILSGSSLIWGAAQLRAFGQVMSSLTMLPIEETLHYGLLFVVIYTFLGGLAGDIISDVIQAVVITLGLALISYHLLSASELPVLDLFQNLNSQRLGLISPHETWDVRLERWAIPILGSLIAQEIISRILAAKNAQSATRACFISGGIYLLVGSIPVMIGLLGPEFIVVKENHEQFILLLAQKYLSPLSLSLFVASLMSALLSTIDSILLAVGGLISHNFLIPKFKFKNKLLTTRIVVVLTAICAYLLATKFDSIFSILELASSFGTSGVLVITIFGLWTKIGTDESAFLTLLVGTFSTFLFEYLLNSSTPFLLSLLSSIVCFVVLDLRRKNETQYSS